MTTRRAALVATAVTLPLVVLLLLLFANLTTSDKPSSTPSSSSALPAIVVPAPPLAAAHAAECTMVLAQLPVGLAGLPPRVVHPRPDSPYVVAWGDPPVILRCGVARPADLHPGSSAQFFLGGNEAGPWYDVTVSGHSNVWTTVDRAVYVQISVPASYHATPLPALSRAIAAALPAVCSVSATAPTKQLCTRRPA
jgi:hypothetical protein